MPTILPSSHKFHLFIISQIVSVQQASSNNTKMNLTNTKNTSIASLLLGLLGAAILVLPNVDAKLSGPLIARGSGDQGLAESSPNDMESKMLQKPMGKKSKNKRFSLRRAEEEPFDDDGLMDFLLSDECSSFMESMNANLETLLSFDDEDIIEYTCSAIERKELGDAADAIEADIGAAEDAPLSCKTAFEMLFFDTDATDHVKTATSSREACVEQMTLELEALHDNRRALAGARDAGDLNSVHRLLLDIIIRICEKWVLQGETWVLVIVSCTTIWIHIEEM